jgi:hypothetical protein
MQDIRLDVAHKHNPKPSPNKASYGSLLFKNGREGAARDIRMLLYRRIPIDIFRDRVLPFIYRPQPVALRDDLLSYHRTVATIKALYSDRFPTGPATPAEDSDLAWLSNDICRFLNNDRPTMLGHVEFYKKVFQRLYLNRSKNLAVVGVPSLFGDEHFNDIKVSVGLLLPDERRQLTAFLGALS